jgi:hypothetical protein
MIVCGISHAERIILLLLVLYLLQPVHPLRDAYNIIVCDNVQ